MTQHHASVSVILLIMWILQRHLALVSHICTLLPMEPPHGMRGCWHCPDCQSPTPKRCANVGIILPNVTTLYLIFGLLWSAGIWPGVIDSPQLSFGYILCPHSPSCSFFIAQVSKTLMNQYDLPFRGNWDGKEREMEVGPHSRCQVVPLSPYSLHEL